MKRAPMWPKQEWAYKRTKKRLEKYDGCLVFMDMGTGKTRVATHIIEEAFEDGAMIVGVVAPIAVMYTWVENWWKWAEKPVTFIDLHETGSAGIRAAKQLARSGVRVVCLINYQKAWQMGYRRTKTKDKKTGEIIKRTTKVDHSFDDLNLDILTLDESTAIKTPGSKTSRFFRKKMAPKAKKRLCLTGSGYTKRPINVWAQAQFILNPDPDSRDLPLFPSTFEGMKARYAIPHPRIRGAIIGYQNLDDLVARLNTVGVLLKQEDVLDLKEPIHKAYRVPLSPATRKAYDKLLQDQYLEFEEMEHAGESVTVNHIFAAITKELQLANGFLVADPRQDPTTGLWTERKIIRIGHEKEDQVIEILQEREEPTVIVVHANEEEQSLAARIEKEFGFKPKILNSKVKGGEARYEMVREASKDLAFIVKESVGCRGTDMMWANLTIFQSHAPNTEDYEQMLKRNQRGEQTMRITYAHILARDTRDEYIMRILENDLNLAAHIERSWRRLYDAKVPR